MKRIIALLAISLLVAGCMGSRRANQRERAIEGPQTNKDQIPKRQVIDETPKKTEGPRPTVPMEPSKAEKDQVPMTIPEKVIVPQTDKMLDVDDPMPDIDKELLDLEAELSDLDSLFSDFEGFEGGFSGGL